VDLVDIPPTHPDVVETGIEIPKRGWAADILSKQKLGCYWGSQDSLYLPKYTATNWMAIVLSDLGMTKNDPRIAKTAGLFFEYWMDEKKDNIFNDEVCIVGNTARFLTRFGYQDDPRVKKLFNRLVHDQREDGGWHCRKTARGTLDGWEALAAFAALPKKSRTRSINHSIERGAEFYLERELLQEGESKYMPWYRLHYPVHYYYDVLVGLDVITALGFGGDRRLRPALEVLERKRREGTWSLERIHPDPASYSWGKHNRRRETHPFALEEGGSPSKIITLNALRVQKRVTESQ
jgi:hypothetical protein